MRAKWRRRVARRHGQSGGDRWWGSAGKGQEGGARKLAWEQRKQMAARRSRGMRSRCRGEGGGDGAERGRAADGGAGEEEVAVLGRGMTTGGSRGGRRATDRQDDAAEALGCARRRGCARFIVGDDNGASGTHVPRAGNTSEEEETEAMKTRDGQQTERTGTTHRELQLTLTHLSLTETGTHGEQEGAPENPVANPIGRRGGEKQHNRTNGKKDTCGHHE